MSAYLIDVTIQHDKIRMYAKTINAIVDGINEYLDNLNEESDPSLGRQSGGLQGLSNLQYQGFIQLGEFDLKKALFDQHNGSAHLAEMKSQQMQAACKAEQEQARYKADQERQEAEAKAKFDAETESMKKRLGLI